MNELTQSEAGMSSLLRLKAFTHWVKLEKEVDDDRLLFAYDIDNLLEVAEAAREKLKIIYGPKLEAEQPCKLLQALKKLDEARRG